jgi:hypothetical protein
MFKKIINLITRKKKLVIVVVVSVVLISLLILSSTIKPSVVTKPPVVGVNTLEIIGAEPTGEVKSLNTTFPVSVKFNEDLGTDVSGIHVTIVPNIPFDKYVLSTQPTVLWLEPLPDNKSQEYGWLEGVKYTVLVEKGSKSSSGAIVEKDFSFSFSNSAEGVSMFVK